MIGVTLSCKRDNLLFRVISRKLELNMLQLLSNISRISFVALWAAAFVPSAYCASPLSKVISSQVHMPSCCQTNKCCDHHCDKLSFSSIKDSVTIQVSAKRFKPLSAFHITSLPIVHREQFQASSSIFNHVYSGVFPPGFSTVLRI
jgi:hypothetical protein